MPSPSIRMPSIFGDHMVLTRDRPVVLFGDASSAGEISIRLGEFEHSLRIEKAGGWKTELPPLAAGGPYELVVRGANTVRFEDVMIGEVWLCSGQSNMEWELERDAYAADELPNAGDDGLRLFHLPRVASAQPRLDAAAQWGSCTSSTAASFSAVAYYFGRRLRNELKVPVGLVLSSWGGTRIEPWTPLRGFELVPGTHYLSRRVEAGQKVYRRELAASLESLVRWSNAARAALDDGRPVPEMVALPKHPLSDLESPTSLYNGMIRPVVPYGIRGVIWYQGEQNIDEGMLYRRKMEALISGWRDAFQCPDLPFFFVQLAPFRYGGNPYCLPHLREAQAASLEIPHTGMAVTMDLGDLDDIHPRNKRDVGERLARIALAKTYGRADVEWSGPWLRSASWSDGRLVVEFDHAEDLSTRDGAPPDGFEIVVSEGEMRSASARIEAGRVVIDGVAEVPHELRYGWHEESEPNLVNGAGLPAAPFRTTVVPVGVKR